jgi:NDP-sugar pyrophosphorylase family protein
MRAMIMAAGLGTRLRPITGELPKPMVPVAGKPVMAHVVDLARRHGLTEIAANLHYLPDTIRGYFGDGGADGVSLRWSLEDELLGTAGGVRNVADFLTEPGEPFVVLSADSLTDVDLGALVAAHRRAGNVATLGLTAVEDPSDFGVVVVDGREQIVEFQEKPPLEEARSNLASCGIYVFDPAIFDFVEPGFQDWAKDVFPRVLTSGRPFGGVLVRGYWNDVGSLGEYQSSNRDALLGTVALALPTDEIAEGVRAGRGVEVAGSAVLEGPILLGDGVRIEDRAWIRGPATISAGAVVGSGAALRELNVWPGFRVPPSTVAVGGVLGDAAALARAYASGERFGA